MSLFISYDQNIKQPMYLKTVVSSTTVLLNPVLIVMLECQKLLLKLVKVDAWINLRNEGVQTFNLIWCDRICGYYLYMNYNMIITRACVYN